MPGYRGKVAVVTGAASGIGYAVAARAAAEGMTVVLADIDTGKLGDAAASLRRTGAEVHSVWVDVSDRESVTDLARRVREDAGEAWLLVNNAGVYVSAPFTQMPAADWEFVVGVNFWGVVHGVETFVPRLLARRDGGHIVNTASMAGLVGMRWLGVYCASKFAVVGLTEALNRELADHGIGVSVLCPMIVQTSINENSVRNRPAALRNPGDDPVADGTLMVGSVIAPDEVARRVVRGIERKDLYILTHPEQREILRRRWTRQDRLFEPDVW